jgi:O-antigen ligase
VLVTLIDLVKLAALVPLFAVAAPLLGLALGNRPAWQRAAFALMCFMTINGLLQEGNWGFTVASIENYRGHTKGYHFYFNQALAVALIIAKLREDPRAFRLIPPNFGFYFFYCAMSFLSVLTAPQVNLVIMALQKMLFASLVGVAAYNVLRTEEDLRFFLKTMALTMTWQLLVVLKMKYLQGMYQVRGTFEHQNPLAMYSIMIAFPLLASSLGPGKRGQNLLFWGFLACAAVVQCTLSRAALVAFVAGTIAVMAIGLAERPTLRRLRTGGLLAAVGGLGLLLSLDTIAARFNERGNQASGELREVMNAASAAMLRDHPFGVGWNNFALAFNQPYPYIEILHEWVVGRGMKVNEEIQSPVVESHYWLLLAETGYPGFVSYLLLIAVALWRNLRASWFFGHSFLRWLSLGILIGCSLNYSQSLYERVLVQPRNLMLWLILLAVSARIEAMRRADRPPDSTPAAQPVVRSIPVQLQTTPAYA